MGGELSAAGNLPFTDCRIVVVGPRNGDDCLIELAHLPKEARIIATGSTLEELQQDGNLFTEVRINRQLHIISVIFCPIHQGECHP